MKRNIAHIITLSNLAIGCLAIIESFYLHFTTASYLIIICLILDSIDGSIARYYNVHNKYGKQLDSLSDMISFGLAPGILIYNCIEIQCIHTILSPYISLFIPVCSAIRLAHYNVDETQKQNFTGLTTPVSALFFISIPLIQKHETNNTILNIMENPYIMTVVIILVPLLLLGKFKTFNLRLDKLIYDNKKMFFLFISMAILFIFKYTGLLIIILMYMLLSITKIIN